MPKIPYSDDRVSRFHPDQVWTSPGGCNYRVISSPRGGTAVLRLGEDGAGRKITRPWDDVLEWTLAREASQKTHLFTVKQPVDDLLWLSAHLGPNGPLGENLGGATVLLKNRSFALGYGSGYWQPLDASIRRTSYTGRGWQGALIRDALATLAKALKVDFEAFEIHPDLKALIGLDGGK